MSEESRAIVDYHSFELYPLSFLSFEELLLIGTKQSQEQQVVSLISLRTERKIGIDSRGRFNHDGAFGNAAIGP